MRRCSTSLIVKKIWVKSTTRCHLTPVGMAIIKKDKKQVLVRMWRKGNLGALLVGMQTGTATVEISMEVPQKIENRTATWSSNSTSAYLSGGEKTLIWKDVCIPVFTAALCTIAKGQEQPNWDISGWRDAEGVVQAHRGVPHSQEGNKNNETPPCHGDHTAAPQGCLMRWKKSDTERQIPHSVTYMWGLKNKKKRMKKTKLTDTENKLAVARGVWGEEGWANWGKGSRGTNFRSRNQ